jgi:hypothetical protein
LNNIERNPADAVAKQLIELLNINDCTTTNLTLESLSQIHAEKLKYGKIVSEFL